jgi:hypothetical protein
MNKLGDASSNDAQKADASVLGFEPFAAAYKSWFVSYPMGMAEETLRFAAHRLEEQAKLISRMVSCKAASEAVEAQISFFNDAVQDYRKEAELIARRAQEAMTSAKEAAAQH